MPLNVIALISGGKDSFFSVLHCLHHKHNVVALANLHSGTDADFSVLDPASSPRHVRPAPEDEDLNSFMYQTVGHGVIPLYAAATGLPVYRRGITGSAAQSGRDYDGAAGVKSDEAESMTELLRGVMARHPEANAVCAGAILSTYQRTRVESVALRLGLTPLAYLWKYPSLPSPMGDDAQLLRDMAAAGLDARIIKVASAGLDEGMLWERISSERGIARARKGLRFFGGDEGAVLGEGGEFETVVVDGPASLFRGRVVVGEEAREVVPEGGGCSWLRFKEAGVEMKGEGGEGGEVRVPDLLDAKFAPILEVIEGSTEERDSTASDHRLRPDALRFSSQGDGIGASGEEGHWGCLAKPQSLGTSIEDEAKSIMDQVSAYIKPHSPKCITNTIVLLRRMTDFPAVNTVYGSLFQFPNPPSRVTISCGDLLPQGHNIAVYVTFRAALAAEDRNGLHVQSRSYWAPANIGPYSQAINVPIHGSQTAADPSAARGPRCVVIAGQIPLVPHTMDLPEPPSLPISIVLSLQHLWRIAVETRVQLWTSAVAYFPRAPGPEEMAHRAALAGAAWRQMHSLPGDDEDEDGEAGPDLWDRKFNPEYMTVGDAPAGPTPLPDGEVFEDDEMSRKEPPLFAVEVEELPRGAPVEWHAHLGLSHVESGTVQTGVYSGMSTFERNNVHWRSHLMVVDCGSQTFLHSTVSIEGMESGEAEIQTGARSLSSVFETIWRDTMTEAGAEEDKLGKAKLPRPYLIYGASKEGQASELGSSGTPFIPCKSIWTPQGKRIQAVGLFRSTL